MKGRRLSQALRKQLSDSRSGEVLFVSHCLLNENARYLGGACARGVVRPLVDDWSAKGYGICQMPCPEQRVWGGVLKPHIAAAFGARFSPLWRVRAPLMKAVAWYTRLRYWLLARQVAGEIRDYVRSGYNVAGVVGVAGSPSCGITRTLDVDRWFHAVARYRPAELSRQTLNREAVIANVTPGEGWFMHSLFGHLRHRGLSVSEFEHDLVAELQGDQGRPEGDPTC